MTRGSDAILQRMLALHPKIIDLTLDRVWRLLEAVGNPQDRLPPVIHIAGTNGKGSTQAMIRAGLEAEGKVVHAYTSPHLARFHERIRLAGTLITEEHLTELLDRAYAVNDGAPITFFEITTVAALMAFAETPADYTLLEVGLGGRLDATNVVTRPDLTVITPVDLDHQAFLGDTLTRIAREKAGILKRGVPCVVAEQHEESLEAIEAVAEKVGAPLLVHGQHWHVTMEAERVVYQDDRGLLDLPPPLLLGPHQVQNAGTAIAALRQLGCGEEACEAALTKPYWPARMERLTRGRLADRAGEAELWLDGGHNPAAGAAIARTLATRTERKTHLICGMLNTKDVGGYLKPLARVVEGLTALTIPNEENSLQAEEMAERAREAGMKVAQTADSVVEAIDLVIAKAPRARILICGSLYLAGHVLRENEA